MKYTLLEIFLAGLGCILGMVLYMLFQGSLGKYSGEVARVVIFFVTLLLSLKLIFSKY